MLNADERYIQKRLIQLWGEPRQVGHLYINDDGVRVYGYDINYLCRFYNVPHYQLLMTIQNLSSV